MVLAVPVATVDVDHRMVAIVPVACCSMFKKKQLPSGWLVNREGGSARCSPQVPTKFYCGRMVMTQDPRTDGFCGPTDGEQCVACQKLNEQQARRYGQIWRQ